MEAEDQARNAHERIIEDLRQAKVNVSAASHNVYVHDQ
jgi:hypothetical protein